MTRRLPACALTPFVRNLAFPEAPRWHDGALWCSDIADWKVLRITPEGQTHGVAEGLVFPNGSVVTLDGRTLIVAETYAGRLSAFRIDGAGALHGKRVWAMPEGGWPDGICLDAEGAVWLASPPTRQVMRVREGGEVTHRVAVDMPAVACMLGGGDRRTLFVLSTALFDEAAGPRRFSTLEQLRERRPGRIDTLRVDSPGAGWP